MSISAKHQRLPKVDRSIGAVVYQSINQFTFLVFRTHQGSQQTITGKSNLNDTVHSMLFKEKTILGLKRPKCCSQNLNL